MKKLHVLIPSLVATASMPLISMVGCGNGEAVPTNITIDKTEVSLVVGQSIQLTATVEPEKASDKVTWTSSDDSIAVVGSNGKVTGIKKGSATITVKPDGYDLQATCKVTVTGVDPSVGEVVVEGLKDKYDCIFLLDRETNPLKIYWSKDKDKIDITDEANIIIDNNNFAYDTSKKCITWSESLAGSYDIHIMAYYQGRCSDLTPTSINIKCDGTLNVTNGGGSQVYIYENQPGSFWVKVIYTPKGTISEIDVTSYVTMTLEPWLNGLEWDGVNKKVFWGTHVDFGGEERISLTLKATLDTLSDEDFALLYRGL